MATSRKRVADYEHSEATRLNNPPAGLTQEDIAPPPTRSFATTPADCVPTMVTGGEWLVSYPAACTLDCHIEFLPDASGGDAAVRAEFEAWIASAAAADPWLRDNPPRMEWLLGAVPSAEIAPSEPVVETLVGVERDLGRSGRIGGRDNWHDGATLVVEAGIPAVCYGAGDIFLAHGADERVPIDELVACAQGIAVAAMRFCGAKGGRA